MRKNDIIELDIEGISAEGRGIGRYEGMAVFVPLTCIGDKIDCKIVKLMKNYAFGIVDSIKVPSNNRINPDCPHFAPCGGCVFRHMEYAAECRAKEDRLREALARIGGFRDLEIEPIVGDNGRRRYRNKAQLPLGLNEKGELIMGFYAAHSHRIVAIEDCLLQPESFSAAMKAFSLWHKTWGESVYSEVNHKGVLRHLYLRRGERSGELMVCIVANAQKLKHEDKLVEILKEALPGLTSIVLNINTEQTNVVLGKKTRLLFGREYIEDELCGLKFRISAQSFYQVNSAQAERLYEKAREYAGLREDEVLLDLYCGTGTIGLCLTMGRQKLFGVEIVPQAVENARENAKRNGIDNAEFLCADAEEATKFLEEKGIKPSVIVLDPPRKGCSQKLIQQTAEMGPRRIVYISCDPATLARDLSIFKGLGYLPKRAAPFDLFPGTAHVEAVVEMTRE